MKKRTAIFCLGGSQTAAAKALGVARSTVCMWRTDDEDNMLSRKQANQVIAALVRRNFEQLVLNPDPNMEWRPYDDATVQDLLTLPVEDD